MNEERRQNRRTLQAIKYLLEGNREWLFDIENKRRNCLKQNMQRDGVICKRT